MLLMTEHDRNVESTRGREITDTVRTAPSLGCFKWKHSYSPMERFESCVPNRQEDLVEQNRIPKSSI